ncbi:MAG: hypothetical protein JW850_13730 [Thermoflexales bacterium]|nr:hypothetical protein [Thermoflexales bacterium]
MSSLRVPQKLIERGILWWFDTSFPIGQRDQLTQIGKGRRTVGARVEVKSDESPLCFAPCSISFCLGIVRQKILAFLAGQPVYVTYSQCVDEMSYPALATRALLDMVDSRLCTWAARVRVFQVS